MLHKPDNMSSLSTPTRLGRGILVPGIDTRPPLDKVNTALSYGGLHTPPHSAHESRRPSLQYGSTSEVPFSASSYTHSQPVTPIHGLNHNADFFLQRWPQSSDAQQTPDVSLPGACSTSPVQEHPFHNAFEPGSAYHNSMVDHAHVYAHLDHANNIDNLAIQPSSCSEAWAQSQVLPMAYAPNASLGTTLFPTPHGMDVPTNSPSSVFNHIASSYHSLGYPYQYNAGAVCATQASYGGPASFQQPRIVIPSQVSPQEDYTAQQLSIYTTPTHNHDTFSSNFSSESIPLNEYEMVRPPSPLDAYFAHSEDEDYLMVKAEDISSPVLGHSSRRSAELAVRPSRRTSRPRRKPGNRQTCCRHEIAGCEVSCQGGQCYAGKYIMKKSDKPYKCKFVKEDGKPCSSSFDRSEHLKRHEGSHCGIDGRKYWCPLEGCNKKIGRPDNAGDHFKTHLRPKSSGKRNAHFPWPEVQNAIWEAYEDKRIAKKLLDGLRRWMNAQAAAASQHPDDHHHGERSKTMSINNTSGSKRSARTR